MVRRIATDEQERKFLEIVDNHGWHAMLVSGDEEGPGFAYSSGIYQRTRAPEIIVFGLPAKVAHWVINEYGARATEDKTPPLGVVTDGFLEGADIVFLDVESEAARTEFTTWTSWYYQTLTYPLVQAVWPDKHGKFPWDGSYSAQLKWLQPLICSSAKLH